MSQITLLALVTVLAWQGIVAARTQQQIVRDLMGDYAQLIVENAERGFNVALGFRTFYALVKGLQNQPALFPLDRAWEPTAFADSTPLPVATEDILAVVTRAQQQDSLRFLWLKPDTDINIKLVNLLQTLGEPIFDQAQFQLRHPELNGVTHTLITVPVPGQDTELLIWLDPGVIVSTVRQQLETATLLPAALGDPEKLRSNINLSLADSAGRIIFSTEHPPDGSLARAGIIDGDYSGLMAGFEIRASINPAISTELIIGGLPYDRLPFLFALLFIALALGAFGFFLMRRQRDVHALRDDFVARVSHELRTPLTQIRMYAESLLHKRILDDDARKDALAVINREALRLGNMVDSILRFEGPQTIAPAFEQTPYLLKKWSNALKVEYQPLLDAENVTLLASIPPNVATRHNRDALTQIAGNLLDNALKYGPNGQQIVISYLALENGWQLGFADQGPGVPAARRESVFEPYRRLSRDQKNGSTGTGIGLSVARDIAISMGGELCFEGESSSGQFVLTLPATKAPPGEKADG